MIKDLPPPTEAEEYRNMAEILRDLAAQTRFGRTRNELVNCADNLDRLAAVVEQPSEATARRVRVS
jgi:molecular chaperone GrpE (heat shock protein)